MVEDSMEQAKSDDSAALADDQAFTAVKDRLTKAKDEMLSVQGKLSSAIKWGQDLSKLFQSNARREKKQIRQIVQAEKERETLIERTARQREQALQRQLANITRQVQLRSVELAKLGKQLSDSKRKFASAEEAWKEREAKLVMHETRDVQVLSSRDNQIRWLRAVKKSEDAELNATKRKTEQVVQLARRKILEARASAQQAQQAMAEESARSKKDEANLQKELAAAQREVAAE